MYLVFKKRKLIKKRVGEKYVQYLLTVPKRFVEINGSEQVFLIATDKVLIVSPREEVAVEIVKKISELVLGR